MRQFDLGEPDPAGIGRGSVRDQRYRTGAVPGRGHQHLVPGRHESAGEAVDDALDTAVRGRGQGRPRRGDYSDSHGCLFSATSVSFARPRTRAAAGYAK